VPGLTTLEGTHRANNNRIRLDWPPSKREINAHYCSQPHRQQCEQITTTMVMK